MPPISPRPRLCLLFRLDLAFCRRCDPDETFDDDLRFTAVFGLDFGFFLDEARVVGAALSAFVTENSEEVFFADGFSKRGSTRFFGFLRKII